VERTRGKVIFPRTKIRFWLKSTWCNYSRIKIRGKYWFQTVDTEENANTFQSRDPVFHCWKHCRHWYELTVFWEQDLNFSWNWIILKASKCSENLWEFIIDISVATKWFPTLSNSLRWSHKKVKWKSAARTVVPKESFSNFFNMFRSVQIRSLPWKIDQAQMRASKIDKINAFTWKEIRLAALLRHCSWSFFET